MSNSNRKSNEETCNTLRYEPESPLTFDSEKGSNYYERFMKLKEKYRKLYKEHNLMLKTINLNSEESKDDYKFQKFNKKITDQQREILNLRQKVDQLNVKVENRKSKRRGQSADFEINFNEGSEYILGLDIGADICLIKFLIHRLVIGQSFKREELYRYREALVRIEEKFGKLAGKRVNGGLDFIIS